LAAKGDGHHESHNIATMTMAALFGKLREHELELGRLNDEED